MEGHLVSIIIPNYNRESLIAKTLDSLISQYYTNWEAIIVDDGSNDESEKIILTYKNQDNRFKYYKRERLPKGAPTCRNIGVQNAKGQYIIFLDSDDILAPYCLASRIHYFKNSPRYDFLIFPMLVFKERPGDSAALWNIDTEEDDLARFLKSDPPWSVTCPIWKHEFIKKLAAWDEEAITWQDWGFHINAIIDGGKYKKIVTLPDCFVRRGANERISLGDMAPERIYSRYNLFLKIFNLLKANQKLTPANKKSFANLLFLHAEKSAIYYHTEPLGENFSKKIVELNLLPIHFSHLQWYYVKLLIYTKYLKVRLFSTLFYFLFRFLLPNYLVKRYSKLYSTYIDEKDLERVRESLTF